MKKNQNLKEWEEEILVLKNSISAIHTTLGQFGSEIIKIKEEIKQLKGGKK